METKNTMTVNIPFSFSVNNKITDEHREVLNPIQVFRDLIVESVDRYVEHEKLQLFDNRCNVTEVQEDSYIEYFMRGLDAETGNETFYVRRYYKEIESRQAHIHKVLEHHDSPDVRCFTRDDIKVILKALALSDDDKCHQRGVPYTALVSLLVINM